MKEQVRPKFIQVNKVVDSLFWTGSASGERARSMTFLAVEAKTRIAHFLCGRVHLRIFFCPPYCLLPYIQLPNSSTTSQFIRATTSYLARETIPPYVRRGVHELKGDENLRSEQCGPFTEGPRDPFLSLSLPRPIHG